MTRREDRFTGTPADAAQYEARRGQDAYDDDRPTRLEAERDEADDWGGPLPSWAKGCTCPLGLKPLGRLHDVSMGNGWVRLTTDPNCPHHANAGTHDD
jgi:hypothetical protein